MATFRLPDLGEGLAEAEIIAWHVKVGDHLRVDEPMVSVETAKAVVEMPAPFNGIVVTLHGAPGDIVKTGAPLIELDAGTVVGHMPAALAEDFPAAADYPLSANRRAGGGGRRAVPAARALARHLDVPIGSLEGSGRSGLVTLDDVLSAAGMRHTRTEPLTVPDGARAEPLRGMRRAMANSMSASHEQVPGSTICDDADIQAWDGAKDYMLRLVRALVSAWRMEPSLNAWYDGAGVTRILHDHVDLAIAVDTQEGLITPVIRSIDTKPPLELKSALAAHKAAAHARRTAPEDLRGFTLMLSNFGTLAGRYGIPRVVPPSVAILGAGKVREEAVVVAGRLQAHRRMPLSLSFDHRCVTGGEACRFLAAIINDLEKPE